MNRTRVQIRPFRSSDLPLVYEAVQESLADVSRWMNDLHADLKPQGVQAYIDQQPAVRQQRKAFNFAIVEEGDEECFLGGCGVTSINWMHQFANVYYWVRSRRTGEGIASSATRLLARFGFEELGLARIEIVVAIGNLASIRVAELVGGQREGLLRRRINVHGAVHDAWMYSLLPGDLA